MKEENKLALVVAYYLSKFDVLAYQKLNLGSCTVTHQIIGETLGVKSSTVQNMRDEFDPIHDNPRSGRHQKPLGPSRKIVLKEYESYNESTLHALVEDILNTNLKTQPIFSDVEKEEILPTEQEAIEGETTERKVLSYKRNSKNTAACKKRDDYTCQACGFHHQEKIVECHHLNPISMAKRSVVTLNDLITLCPTCHRLAHNLIRQNQKYTKKQILIPELKKIIN